MEKKVTWHLPGMRMDAKIVYHDGIYSRNNS